MAEPMNQQEIEQVTRLLGDPLSFPLSFKQWLTNWLEVNPPKTTVTSIVNGTSFVQAAVSTVPPSTPFDQQVWIYPVNTSGTRWHFQYNASSASSFKWEFIGGAPISVSPANFNPGAVSGFQVQSGAGNTITLPRAGDYELRMTGYNNDVTTSNTNQVSIGYAINGTQTGKWAQMGLVSAAYVGWFPYHVEDLLAGRAAGDVVAPTVNPDSRDQTLVNTYLNILPRRVS